MSWKLLRLKPHKPFFFGKQRVFTNTNHATSEYFPQQTQIAGALRLYLMEQAGHIKVHKTGRFCAKEETQAANALVGKANSNDFDKNDDLGVIEFISPIFITRLHNDHITDLLFEIPKDITNQKIDNTISPAHIANPKLNGEFGGVFLEHYDVKVGFATGLGNRQFWENYQNNIFSDEITSFDKVFKPYHQVGIGLKDKRVIDEQFYTKTSYLLEKDFEFALLVQFGDDIELKGGIMTLGAENSTFQITFQDIPNVISDHPIVNALINREEVEGKKIVLLSDAILNESIAGDAYYQITPYKVPFKMMMTKSNEWNPSSQKTENRSLTSKGSVYFFDQANKLPQATGAYKKMGFNHYLVIQK